MNKKRFLQALHIACLGVLVADAILDIVDLVRHRGCEGCLGCCAEDWDDSEDHDPCHMTCAGCRDDALSNDVQPAGGTAPAAE